MEDDNFCYHLWMLAISLCIFLLCLSMYYVQKDEMKSLHKIEMNQELMMKSLYN